MERRGGGNPIVWVEFCCLHFSLAPFIVLVNTQNLGNNWKIDTMVGRRRRRRDIFIRPHPDGNVDGRILVRVNSSSLFVNFSYNERQRQYKFIAIKSIQTSWFVLAENTHTIVVPVRWLRYLKKYVYYANIYAEKKEKKKIVNDVWETRNTAWSAALRTMRMWGCD